MSDDLLERLNAVDRRGSPAAGAAVVRPRDAATLIIIERGPVPRVLVGRRHRAHVFMPGKFVFPGGRVDPGDARIRPAAGYDADVATRLSTCVTARQGPARTRALGIAAIRETYEEAGILIGGPATPERKTRPPGRGGRGHTTASGGAPHDDTWAAFAARGLAPSLAPLRFVARAVTPTGRPRRFDARFFAVWSDAVTARLDGPGPSGELEEVQWMPLDDAADLDLPAVTRIVIAELKRRLAVDPDLTAALSVPFYRWSRTAFIREEI